MELKHPESYYIRVLLNKIPIEEIMVKAPITIDVDEPFSRVAEIFRKFHIRHLPVIDKDRKLAGIITQRDLYRIQSPRKDAEGNWYYDKESLDTYILKHVMTRDVYTLAPTQSVATAILKMSQAKYGCIPIVTVTHTLCGIITKHDIIKIAAQILQE